VTWSRSPGTRRNLSFKTTTEPSRTITHADISSVVKHAAREEEPLLTSAERVERALARLTAGRQFIEAQQQWLV
jgi:EcoEI R protein C-terminal